MTTSLTYRDDHRLLVEQFMRPDMSPPEKVFPYRPGQVFFASYFERPYILINDPAHTSACLLRLPKVGDTDSASDRSFRRYVPHNIKSFLKDLAPCNGRVELGGISCSLIVEAGSFYEADGEIYLVCQDCHVCLSDWTVVTKTGRQADRVFGKATLVFEK